MKPTVTIALSAFNEQENVLAFITSVLQQKEVGFTIKNIWIYNDGSTDDTAKLIQSLGSPRIQLIDDKKRVGKSSRLNEIYTRLDTDFLVQTDADIIFSHEHVIRDILQPLLNDQKVGMCGGDPRPLPAVTFTEKAVNLTAEVYMGLRNKGVHGDNVYSVDGRLLAYRKELVKKIHVPSDMIANDAYTFYCCLTAGYQYRYVESAVVLYRSPQTLNDQIRQNTRFLSAPIRMSRYFPEELVYQQRQVPVGYLLLRMATQFLRYPIHCGYIFCVNLYCKLMSKTAEKRLTAQWPIAFSTKQLQEPDNRLKGHDLKLNVKRRGWGLVFLSPFIDQLLPINSYFEFVTQVLTHGHKLSGI